MEVAADELEACGVGEVVGGGEAVPFLADADVGSGWDIEA